MYQPTKPNFPLCRDCRFFIPAEGRHNDLCGHDSAIKFDFVHGDHTRYSCDLQRKYSCQGECSPSAKYFEPVIEAGAVEIEAPADVVALLTTKAEGV